MPKKGMTDAQKGRYDALKLVLENYPERILAQPWKTADQVAAYLRTGDPKHKFAADGNDVARSKK